MLFLLSQRKFNYPPDGLFKIPVPLETTEVQTASRRARALWSGRDAPVLGESSGEGRNRSRADSFGSSYQQTIIGASHPGGGGRSRDRLDHHIACRSCHRVSRVRVTVQRYTYAMLVGCSLLSGRGISACAAILFLRRIAWYAKIIHIIDCC